MNDQVRRRSVGAPAARTTLLTLLGEYVLPLRDGVWQETLVTALTDLGHKPQAARQAVVRSVAGGWLRTERHGRHSRISITAEFEQMIRDAAARIYHFGEPKRWTGEWLLVMLRVPEERREARDLVRSQLAWAGFGSLGNGMWISPHVEREDELRAVVTQAPAAELISFRASLGAMGQPERVVANAWDLGAVSEGYEKFIAEFADLHVAAPKPAFCAHSRLVNEWRRFPYLDPDLPEQMLPERWPRTQARQIFEHHYDAWVHVARDYFRALDEAVEGRARIRAA